MGNAAVLKKQLILPYKRAQTPKPQIGSEKLHGRPLVVGLGPAGLMAALELAENGYHPLVVERDGILPTA